MTEDEQDDAIRRAFRELREEDRRAMPRFHPAAAATPPSGPVSRVVSHRWAWVAAAAAVVVAAGAGLTLRDESRGRPRPLVEASLDGLAAWESPTEHLLRTPGRGLIGELPRVGRLDFATVDPAGTKDAGSVPLRH